MFYVDAVRAISTAGAAASRRETRPTGRATASSNTLRRSMRTSKIPAFARNVKPEPIGTPVVPKDFQPKADVPLTSTALEAVRVSEHWQGERTRLRQVPMAA